VAMKVKMFDENWSVDLPKFEDRVNAFLASLPPNAVKHVHTAMAATRTADTDQGETHYLITVWYDD
jgi:hypothetical protein